MAILNLSSVLKIFGGGELSDAEKAELFEEAIFMTLARATASDTNIAQVEVQKVQEILKRETGKDVEAKDIRVEAIQHAFETASFDSLLEKAGEQLDQSQRMAIAKALRDLMKSDDNVSPFEAEFFNTVIADLKLDAADVSGL